MPPRDAHFTPGKRPRWNPRDLLTLLYREMTVAILAAGDLAAGKALSANDRNRLYQAHDRLTKILEVTRAIG